MRRVSQFKRKGEFLTYRHGICQTVAGLMRCCEISKVISPAICPRKPVLKSRRARRGEALGTVAALLPITGDYLTKESGNKEASLLGFLFLKDWIMAKSIGMEEVFCPRGVERDLTSLVEIHDAVLAVHTPAGTFPLREGGKNLGPTSTEGEEELLH